MSDTCTKCGSCCERTQLLIFPSEIEKIKKFIKKNHIQPCDHTPTPGNSPMAAIDITCPFLDTTKTKKCTIYPVRPRICQNYYCHGKLRLNMAMELTKQEKMWLINAPFGKKETHMGQTFFPERYMPKTGDVVVISKLYTGLFKKYGHRPFICNGKRISMPGLTVVEILDLTQKADPIQIDSNALDIVTFIKPKSIKKTK